MNLRMLWLKLWNIYTLVAKTSSSRASCIDKEATHSIAFPISSCLLLSSVLVMGGMFSSASIPVHVFQLSGQNLSQCVVQLSEHEKKNNPIIKYIPSII